MEFYQNMDFNHENVKFKCRFFIVKTNQKPWTNTGAQEMGSKFKIEIEYVTK